MFKKKGSNLRPELEGEEIAFDIEKYLTPQPERSVEWLAQVQFDLQNAKYVPKTHVFRRS